MAQDDAQSLTVELYGNGLFGRYLPPVNQYQLTLLQQSGFTSVVLWTLHVDPDGSLSPSSWPN